MTIHSVGVTISAQQAVPKTTRSMKPVLACERQFDEGSILIDVPLRRIEVNGIDGNSANSISGENAGSMVRQRFAAADLCAMH
jgi:hypothetical protein